MVVLKDAVAVEVEVDVLDDVTGVAVNSNAEVVLDIVDCWVVEVCGKVGIVLFVMIML